MSEASVDPQTPVLVGAGQFTWKGAPEEPRTYKQMLVEGARRALADAAGDGLGEAIDEICVMRFWIDSIGLDPAATPRLTNPPASLAQALGLTARRHVYAEAGGNTPQLAVNAYAEAIARGELRAVLIAGAEAHRSWSAVRKAGGDLSVFAEDLGAPDGSFGDPRAGYTAHELAHGVGVPSTTYPLFEQAYRMHRRRSRRAHREAMGHLMSRLSAVAANNPDAWLPIERTPEEITAPTAENRLVSTPYTKYMNANDSVDQAAALILTSVGEAEARGIARDKWVFLNGCAEANDLWYVHQRVDFHSCAPIRAMTRAAMEMAGIGLTDIDLFDLYSCFPVAVEIALDEIGLVEGDERPLSVTGGLPYFGGPGNNYTTHAIAEMMARLRAAPGTIGLVTANGWYLTKHAVGIYSTKPADGPWQRGDSAALQARLDRRQGPPFTETPSGAAQVETYTVFHDREGPRKVILFGRLGDGTRFLANTPRDRPDLLALFAEEDLMNATGSVSCLEGRNLFVPAA